MEQAWVRITDPIGLHARPAALLVQAVGRYQARVWLEYDEREAAARSIIQLLSLGLRQGSRVRVCAEGPEEVAALAAALATLIAEPAPDDGDVTALAGENETMVADDSLNTAGAATQAGPVDDSGEGRTGHEETD